MPITLISVSRATLFRAQFEILGCESCSERAEIQFDRILDRVTGRQAGLVEYLLPEPAVCWKCFGEVGEKTLVEG